MFISRAGNLMPYKTLKNVFMPIKFEIKLQKMHSIFFLFLIIMKLIMNLIIIK